MNGRVLCVFLKHVVPPDCNQKLQSEHSLFQGFSYFLTKLILCSFFKESRDPECNMRIKLLKYAVNGHVMRVFEVEGPCTDYD